MGVAIIFESSVFKNSTAQNIFYGYYKIIQQLYISVSQNISLVACVTQFYIFKYFVTDTALAGFELNTYTYASFIRVNIVEKVIPKVGFES